VEKASWAPEENGWCQKEQRLVIQQVYGNKYDAYMKATANLTGRAFQAAGLAMTAAQAGTLQVGDILYKCPADLTAYGHVGTFVGNKGVAENSSTSIGRVRGALGYRSVARFGEYQLVVRLPPLAPTKPARLILGVKDGDKVHYVHLQSAALKNGHFDVDVTELAKILLGNNEEIRPLLAAFGYNIYQEGDHLNDPADPCKYLFIQKNLPAPDNA